MLRVSPNALLLGTRGEEKIEFNNIRLYERFRALDQLPKDEQEVALQILDVSSPSTNSPTSPIG